MTAAPDASIPISDLALLRQVFTWARTNGWRPVVTDRMDREWSADGDHLPVVCLYRPCYDGHGVAHYGNPGLRVYFSAGRWRCVDVPSTTVREAVDILAALGVLPGEFSSQRRNDDRNPRC